MDRLQSGSRARSAAAEPAEQGAGWERPLAAASQTRRKGPVLLAHIQEGPAVAVTSTAVCPAALESPLQTLCALPCNHRRMWPLC